MNLYVVSWVAVNNIRLNNKLQNSTMNMILFCSNNTNRICLHKE